MECVSPTSCFSPTPILNMSPSFWSLLETKYGLGRAPQMKLSAKHGREKSYEKSFLKSLDRIILQYFPVSSGGITLGILQQLAGFQQIRSYLLESLTLILQKDTSR